MYATADAHRIVRRSHRECPMFGRGSMLRSASRAKGDGAGTGVAPGTSKVVVP
jgi:hypothetical protein